MPITTPFAGRRQSHLPRTAALALAALASTALTAPVRASEFPAAIPLSSLNGTIGFRLDGVKGGDYSGYSVASAGDVNGDGFADLIVGARGAVPNGTRSGSSFVVFGKAAGFTPVIALASLIGSTGFHLDGVAAFDASGWSVASGGDVNGDGFADVIIGAPRCRSSWERLWIELCGVRQDCKLCRGHKSLQP
ncbi:MAG: integrin alpha [Hyphomicrobiales bacterium]